MLWDGAKYYYIDPDDSDSGSLLCKARSEVTRMRGGNGGSNAASHRLDVGPKHWAFF
jgi:hypothetical protein